MSTGNPFLTSPELSYRGKQTTNGRSSALPMAMAVFSSEGCQQNLGGRILRLVFPLSVLTSVFFLRMAGVKDVVLTLP